MKAIRLDKFLADMGLGTRSEVKSFIKKKQIQINNIIQTDPSIKVDTENDTVSFNGRIISYTEFEYYMLNKPKGYVSATVDNLHPTVVSLIKDNTKKGLFPVGRLDIDTEGLLLITNDGELAHNLLAPTKHVEKTYYVEVDNEITPDVVSSFREGMDIGEKKNTMPSELKVLSQKNTAFVTIKEGKFHQIKRMFQKNDLTVTYLKRVSMGNLKLDENLKPGEYKLLTKEDIQGINKC